MDEFVKRPLGSDSSGVKKLENNSKVNLEALDTDTLPAAPEPAPKKPKGKTKTLAIIMTVLFLAAAGAAGFLIFDRQQLQKDKKDLSSEISEKTNEAEKIKSELESKISELEKNKTPANSQTPTTTKTDAQLASEAARAFYAAKLTGAQDITTFTANQVQESGSFRRFSVSKTGEMGGASVIVKKVGTVWVGVAAGQGQPSKETGESYGLPAGWYSTEY